MIEIPQVSKEKPIFIRNPYVYVCYMQYLSTMYTYYVFLSRVWYVYAYIHALSMIRVYICVFVCLFVLCYVDCCSLSFSCLSFVEEDRGKCYCSGTQ